MASTNASYQPWPKYGESYNLGLTTVIIASTTFGALLARLYVTVRHRRELRHLFSTVSLSAAHLCAFVQASLVVAAAYYGWGSSGRTLPDDILRTAVKLLFASDVLLLLVHAFSRGCIAITLLTASEATQYAKYAWASLVATAFWAIGSILGLVLNRLRGPDFWLPAGQDCEFTLWVAISLAGLGVDIAVAACGARITMGLQMARSKKFYTIMVFSCGILVIAPTAYGLTHLHQQSSLIARDPTTHTLRWIYTNQAAISISLWCRVLEAARRLQQDMGYATYGHSGDGLSSYGVGSKRPTGYYARGSKPSRSHNVSKTKQSKNSKAEDEIELRSTWHTANAARDHSKRYQSESGGIEVTQEYGYSEQSLRSGDT